MSKEGEQFILDLNLYLMSTGKSEKEIKDFIEEAEEHLKLGESEGKSVEDIFGSSPKEYAASVAEEISFDKKEVISSVMMLIFGLGMALFFSKIENGIITISSIELFMDVAIYIVTIAMLLFFSKKFAFDDKKLTKSLMAVFIGNVICLVGAGLLGKASIQDLVLSRIAVAVTILVSAVICLLISIKIKTFIIFAAFIWSAPAIASTFFKLDIKSWTSIFQAASFILAVVFIRLESKRIMKS